MQFADAEFVRPDVIERSEPAAEDMIPATEEPRALDGQDIRRVFDYADFGSSPGLVPADFAGFPHAEKPADAAGAEVLRGRLQGGGEVQRACVAGGSQPEGNTLGAARADAGQTPELSREFAERLRIINRLHEGSSPALKPKWEDGVNRR